MIEYDKGPTKKIAKLFAQAPDYTPYKHHFWFDWGPIFYRGRLNGSARLLCVASDPGPTERIAGRALVGDAGQRVQGFFSKLGLTRSYLCLNAFIYAFHPSHFYSARKVLEDIDHTKWRNRVFDRLTSKKLKAVVAFGSLAQIAVDLWDGKGKVKVFETYHPSYRDQAKLIPAWRDLIKKLRKVVTPDPDGHPLAPNYGSEFAERDYSPIPGMDLPFGMPEWFGDDAWGRLATPKHSNCVSRPRPDDGHTLKWIAPVS